MPTVRSRFLASALVALALTAPVTALSEDRDAPDVNEQAADLQDRMSNDPEVMEKIDSLRDDPLMQEILHDPSVAAALRSGDLGALLTNPKIGELMERPAVQDITRDLEE